MIQFVVLSFAYAFMFFCAFMLTIGAIATFLSKDGEATAKKMASIGIWVGIVCGVFLAIKQCSATW